MELSPKSMAEAAYTAAVAQRDRNTNAGTNDSDSQGHNDHNANANEDNFENAGARIEQIWKKGDSGDENLDATLRLLVSKSWLSILCLHQNLHTYCFSLLVSTGRGAR